MSRHSTPSPPSMNNNPPTPDSAAAAAATVSSDPYFDDSSVVDMDQFAKTLSNIKSKNVRPDLLASIITHYASKWLPELSSDRAPAPAPTPASSPVSSSSSTTANWLKKRFFVENLVSILPSEKGSLMPCEFLLRLLRAASMVGARPAYLAELEAQVAYQLEQASLREVMIPSFSHTCGTLLDVALMLRLVRKFLASEEAARSGVAMVKVAKLVDAYLAEAALDAGLTVAEFEQLASAMPSHARATDDGLYQAVDTYIKAHQSTTKQEKKVLSKLIDPRKLTPEAALHAVHNERLPVRSVIQVLFSEHTKVNRISEWSGTSFSVARSPSPTLDGPGRCPSKREVLVQQHEMRKLREDVARLQTQCRALQAQIDRLGSDKKKKGIFRWSSFLFRNGEAVARPVDDYEAGLEKRMPRTPMDGPKGRLLQGKGTTPNWRNSLS